MKQKLGKVFTQLRGRWLNGIHHPRMKKTIDTTSDEYADYLDLQLERTLRKNDNRLKKRTIDFIEQLSRVTDLSNATVLSVGCRNHAELDFFTSKGVEKAIGIDLYSNTDDILVMDMHQMTFLDNTFDIVYSSHSLEHSYDIQKVANEFARVCKQDGLIAIEMPVNFEPRGADLVDIENIEALSLLFSPHIETMVWHEYIKKNTTPFNANAIRVIYKMKRIDDWSNDDNS